MRWTAALRFMPVSVRSWICRKIPRVVELFRDEARTIWLNDEPSGQTVWFCPINIFTRMPIMVSRHVQAFLETGEKQAQLAPQTVVAASLLQFDCDSWWGPCVSSDELQRGQNQSHSEAQLEIDVEIYRHQYRTSFFSCLIRRSSGFILLISLSGKSEFGLHKYGNWRAYFGSIHIDIKTRTRIPYDPIGYPETPNVRIHIDQKNFLLGGLKVLGFAAHSTIRLCAPQGMQSQRSQRLSYLLSNPLDSTSAN